MKVLISEIENREEKLANIEFCEEIEELDTNGPVEGSIVVSCIGDDYINIAGEIHAKLRLVCDSCLKDFEKEIKVEINETLARKSLYDEYREETELKEGAFIEDLNGKDEIDITDIIYQSVILSLPNKHVCGINCIGDENINKYIKKETSDPRLEIFKTIKIEKDN